jgi:hypothetical protein
MSFTPVNLAPGCVVVAGVIALVLGYTTVGWWLIGTPFALGVLVYVWLAIVALLEKLQKPKTPES